MSLFDDVVSKAKVVYPDISIKYKNESLFMKILGILLFFNPSFKNIYITTIGKTIYFPSSDFIANSPTSSAITLLHELVHIADNKNIFYSILYLFPQLLSLLFIPLLFIVGWKFALIALIFLLPLPAYFRMKDEKSAYTMSLYACNSLNKIGYNINLQEQVDFYISQFKGFGYYVMWPFGSIDAYFNTAAKQIASGQRPSICASNLYDITDKILQQ